MVDATMEKEDLQEILEKLEAQGQSFRLSDLPKSICDQLQVVLKDPDLLGAVLKRELVRCFDIESVSNLVRLSGPPDGIEISMAVSEEDRDLWHFRLGMTESGITTDGRIEDMVLFPKERATSEEKAQLPYIRFQGLIEEMQEEIREYESPQNYWYLFEDMFYLASTSGRRGETHYLPAARSGIMQSHRVIASSLVGRSTRAGLEHFPELPTFSGVMADFMQQLILYEEDRGFDKTVHALADALENEALAGQIRSRRPPLGGYPEFVYRPRDTEEDIRLTRASSMVSELAPVVLFLRGAINCGDLLIIEEPEAHLHPAAQTRMAVTLARMVRTGVRVVVTTHSDWLLKEIGNLMREGDLGEKTGEPTSEESLPSSLRPSDVGIWLFHKNGTLGGSTVEEIPFDRSEGVEPPDYEDVAEELYNRSANLQNRFEETAGNAEPGNE